MMILLDFRGIFEVFIIVVKSFVAIKYGETYTRVGLVRVALVLTRPDFINSFVP